jgi:hypothetical protein
MAYVCLAYKRGYTVRFLGGKVVDISTMGWRASTSMVYLVEFTTTWWKIPLLGGVGGENTT